MERVLYKAIRAEDLGWDFVLKCCLLNQYLKVNRFCKTGGIPINTFAINGDGEYQVTFV